MADETASPSRFPTRDDGSLVESGSPQATPTMKKVAASTGSGKTYAADDTSPREMSRAQLFAVAAVGLLFGPLLAIWPYKMARWSEVLDSIGRKPAGRVEPAAWKVLLNRILGIVLVIAGVISAILFFV
jgi:hypothetical protein